MVGKKTRTGSVPEGDARLSVNVDKKLHRRLKIEAAKKTKPKAYELIFLARFF